MLSVLHYTVDHVREFHGVEVDLATLPQEPEVYEMLSRADSIGVFQVESRAQMATLPRLKPETFYDLVVEVALIRPGPIQGGSVHPYIRRRNGTEPVTYLHPLLERSLAKTLGVPLFQEQLMQMAIDVAGFTPAESDRLRQAMGSKRSVEKMEQLRARLYAGMAVNGITGEVADQIFDKLVAFANFGFPESHSVSFAYLVYSSAWLKCHYPAAFCAGLLDGQPMGFWSPQTIVADARRHGVVVRRPDINASRSRLHARAVPDQRGRGRRAPRSRIRAPGGSGHGRADRRRAALWRHGGPGAPDGSDDRAVGGAGHRGCARMPSSSVRVRGRGPGGRSGPGPSGDVAARGPVGGRGICPGRTGPGGPIRPATGRLRYFHEERARPPPRCGCLGAGGAGESAGFTNRADQVGTTRTRTGRLAGLATGAEAPPLPDMTAIESNRADLWATGLSPDRYPTEFVRAALA